MTYYLVRHLQPRGTDVVPFRADNDREAVKLAIQLHEPRALALYAHVQDNHGRIFCTLSGNEHGPGQTKAAWDQALPLHRKPMQLELPFK